MDGHIVHPIFVQKIMPIFVEFIRRKNEHVTFSTLYKELKAHYNIFSNIFCEKDVIILNVLYNQQKLFLNKS